jgi:hypothetical protein
MASVVISGNTSGSVTLSAPAVAGSSTQTLVAATGTLAPIVSGTAVASTSGTSIDFTGIPNWVKRITVMFNGVSTNATNSSRYLIQIGTGGTPTITGYLSQASSIGSATNTSLTSGLITTGFVLQGFLPFATAHAFSGSIVITNITGNTWVSSGNLSNDSAANGVAMSAGRVSLSGVLDMVRITSVSTPDTFDAGTINIMYE